MKRIIRLLLVIVIMILTTITSYSTESSEKYYSIQVEYSDNIGQKEQLDIMICNSNVYVNAKMLVERLKYSFFENNDNVVIYNKDISKLPFCITQFKYNSTQVSHMLFNNMIDTYEAPFASIKNSKGSWIPFEYSLLLINSSMMITDNTILIDMPTKKIIDYYYDIAKNSSKYNFDWADDFGYTETDIKILGGSSHLVNVFNGLLEFDDASWTILFQQFTGSLAAYDKKYGENLAMLLCTESDKELQATIDKVDMYINLLDNEGTLGDILSNTSKMLDSDVATLYENCERILQKVKSGNSPLLSYNKSYQALENALNKQTWFSNTGGTILEIQKGVSDAAGKAFTFLDIGLKIAEIVGYAQEFQNQDKFSLAALTYYLDNASNGLELPKAMKQSMIDYSDALSSSIDKYMTKRFAENINQWVIDEVPIHEVLGIQAATTLFAWNIASNTIPFISNGLSGSDNLELALYSMVFQNDTFLNYLSKRNSVFSDENKITSENIYNITQYCYIYLKSCYITREAALGSLMNKTNSTKEKIQSLIDYQNSINSEIAKIMVELKEANRTNERYVFGFLPSDNKKYLDIYDDSQLIAWVKTTNLVTNAYSKEFDGKFDGRKFNIPKINLNSSAVVDINAEIWANLYDGVVVETLNCYNQNLYGGGISIEYEWSVNNDVLSLVIISCPVDFAYWYDYYIYNISVPDGKIISNNEIISIAGLSQSEYHDIVKQALGSAYFQGKELYSEETGYDVFFHKQLENTISEDNIQSCIPYFNENGQLCIIGAVYSLADANYYFHEINLENFEYSSAFNEYIEMQAEAVNSNSIIERYKVILMQHPKKTSYYTLYDIDKDDIPELIINQGFSEYYIYSFNGTDVVSSEVYYWFYSNCLYEYEGNGIIVHEGGNGSMRIEYVSLYSLENNKLKWAKELKTAANLSFDELNSFLDDLTPINDFHPIDDYSYLSR